VGNSLFQTLISVLKQPEQLLWLLARTLPFSTHFYLNYMTVQCGVEGLQMMRMAQLVKFTALKPIFGEDRAKELCEPEDQAAGGIGGRSARLAALLVIALVFSTLAPSILLISLVNFSLARVVYTYLFTHAETRKGDSGGIHWETQIKNVQYALLIYILLMTGVLYERKNWICALIAAASVTYWKYVMDKAAREVKVETLSFAEIRSVEEKEVVNVGYAKQFYSEFQRHFGQPEPPKRFEYRQPELDDRVFKQKEDDQKRDGEAEDANKTDLEKARRRDSADAASRTAGSPVSEKSPQPATRLCF